MDDSGQMIILAALFACLCLMGTAACMMALENSAYPDTPRLSADELANVRRAQENALQHITVYYSSCGWDDRVYAVTGFRASANASADNMSVTLLKRGIVYRFSLNNSRAMEYVFAHPGNGTESIGGVLVEKNGNSARISGCAYDMEVDDKGISYRLGRVVEFG